MNSRHLYVHVPFCARRCTYCDFSIAVRRRVPVAAYVEAVEREAALAHRGGALATVYLGGGTPSRLGGEGVAALLRGLGAPRDLDECTLEANPEDVTPEAVRVWVASGVTRLSIGAQSFSPAALRWMHRTHDVAAIGAAVAAARAGGIRSVSLDLIFALPAAVQRSWEADLRAAAALEPEHLSLYGLTVEPHTPLAHRVARREAAEADESRYEGEYLAAHEVLGRLGYRFYEVSNAARPGYEAVHNRAYWRLVPYLGLGPSAHSFDGERRWWNEPAWTTWHRLVEQGTCPVAGEERLTLEQRRTERLYLSLRTAEGLPLGPDADPALLTASERWTRAGWATVEAPSAHSPLPQPQAPSPRLSLTPQGWLRLDALVASL